MKTAIAYEVFDFLNVYIFEDFLISNVRMSYIIYIFICIYLYIYIYIYILYIIIILSNLLNEKKTEKNQNSAIIMISVDGKGTVFPVKLKLQGESFK